MGLMINKTTNEVQHCPSENVMIKNGWSANDWAFFDEEITADKVYNYADGELIDISQTAGYKTKIKKQKKNNAYKTYQEGLTQLKSEDELNQFLKSCGKITQSEYDSRLAIITTDLTALQSTYSTEVADD